MANVSLRLVVEPLWVNASPVALVSVSHTVPSSLRKVRWNAGVLVTSTRRPEVVTVNGLPSTTALGGRVQFLTTVKEAFVLNATPLGAMCTRTTFASTNSTLTTAPLQVNVSSRWEKTPADFRH